MSNPTKSTQAKALLASPFLDDPNFRQTVVYMVMHNSEHAYGLIVNRPFEQTIASVLEIVTNQTVVCEGRLHCGGPVDGPLIALHDQPDLADFACDRNLFVTTDRENILPLLSRPHARLKLFDGVSCWSGGQLESEMADGSWLVTDIDADDVWGEREQLWTTLLHRVGHQVWSTSGFDLGDPAKAHWN